MLLCTQDVTGTAELQVFHGDMKAGAQFREIFQYLHSSPGIIAQAAVRGIEKVRIGLPV